MTIRDLIEILCKKPGHLSAQIKLNKGDGLYVNMTIKDVEHVTRQEGPEIVQLVVGEVVK